IFLIGYLFTIMAGCKGVAKNDVNHSTSNNLEKELPEGFLAFLDVFSTDSAYQMKSIIWPIDVQKAMAYEDDDIEIVKMNKNEWIIQKPFNDMNGTYMRSFDVFNDIVTEFISDESGQYT
ncbi:MAG TPA: hypothetical protein PKD85_10635, partial [Saprospiraceae bacterium]|nr:hypothetical protein [Saprospiraceae bacterium]